MSLGNTEVIKKIIEQIQEKAKNIEFKPELGLTRMQDVIRNYLIAQKVYNPGTDKLNIIERYNDGSQIYDVTVIKPPQECIEIDIVVNSN